MNIIVTSPGRGGALLIRASTLSVHIGHVVAEAFTAKQDKLYPLHEMLVQEFGQHEYRWYCIDMSDISHTITFSDSANPRVLNYQGAAAAIAASDRAVFTLQLQTCDLVKPGRLDLSAEHPHFVAS
jgi:hypothetical protein